MARSPLLTPSIRGLTLLALLTSSAAIAQSTTPLARVDISGLVTNAAGATPIAGVEIVLVGTDRRGRSDVQGQFLINGVGPGAHMLVARKPGFAPESLSVSLADTAAHVRFTLRAVIVQTLEEVAVTATPAVSARLEGFELRRKRRNGGHFITREDIERRGSNQVSDVLRRAPGIRMVDSMGVKLAISSRSPKVNLLSKQVVVNCVVRVGVDGSMKEPGFPVDALYTKDIYGIEVYGGAATIPPEFNSAGRDAFCGLIMIWTRSY